MRPRFDESRSQILDAMTLRRSEILEAVLSRVRSIGEPQPSPDAEYLKGVRQAAEGAINHSIESSRRASGRPSPTPDLVLEQARLAARRGTPLETVLRRYQAGHAVLADFIVEEAEKQDGIGAPLREILRSQAAGTDLILGAISTAYRAEREAIRPRSSTELLAERIDRLLEGELIDLDGLGYDLDRWHIGVVVRGAAAIEAINTVSDALDARRLKVPQSDGSLFVWFGLQAEARSSEVSSALPFKLPADTRVAIGEAGWGSAGWRLTHAQARAAFAVGIRTESLISRYVDVALLASALQDEVLMNSLQMMYLDPLDDRHDPAALLRATLRAYLEGDLNLTSAAAKLGVSRNTVANRLRAVENRIGTLLPTRTANLALALQLAELT